MKKLASLLSAVLALTLLTGCAVLGDLADRAQDVKTITPSTVIITEARPISGVTGLNLRTFGKVTISQGDQESLTISGSDNLVPLVKTSVQAGQLSIEMKEPVSITNLNSEDQLHFILTVKDLTALTVSGLGDIQMDELSTSALTVTMSGAGRLDLANLSADSVDITLSGLGSVEIAGKVARQTIAISGAGAVQNGELECQTASVSVPGLGSATVWATEQLTGKISGSGSVAYYGNPQTSTETTGLGQFKALGGK